MHDIFEAFTARNLTKQRKSQLADILDTVCKCTNATGTFNAGKLETLSERFLRGFASEIKWRPKMQKYSC